jgi:quinol monooxygenase YgiN/mannose-6-phosphate isomerase-like protein (cupin superfamily)
MKFTAKPGQGGALAELLVRVAESLRGTPGCELYVINRSATEADVVWVTELWLNQELLDAALEQLRNEAGQARVAEVNELVAGPPERIDLEPLGGVGYLTGGTGYTHINLDDIEDMAARFGLAATGEARFATGSLNTANTGISHQRLRPNARQSFGHRHQHSEEVVVVLSGSGRVKIDDDIRDVHVRDAIRIAPTAGRAFEAGEDGLEFLIFGPHLRGDAIVDPTFWPTGE